MRFRLVVIGCSWGGLTALRAILGRLPGRFPAPIAVVQHRSASAEDEALAKGLASHCSIPVRSVEDKEPIVAGNVFLAPPDYHLLVEPEAFALSVDERVQYSRPSIDVLFESAAAAYGAEVVGVILTGANADGAAGLRAIHRAGGYGIVQDPSDAERAEMPRAAIDAGAADEVLVLGEIGPTLVRLCAAGPPVERRLL